MKILIYGGTTEGRRLAEILKAHGLEPVVSVATEYGEEVMENADPDIDVRTGRLSMQEMHDLAVSGSFAAVVDATHPFAVEVSRNIRESVKGTEIPLIRLVREDKTDIGRIPVTGHRGLPVSGCADLADNAVNSDRQKISSKLCRFFSSVAECASALYGTEGNILLTTGSKELGVFCKDEAVRKRIIARVLPGEESLRLCREAGLTGKQIAAMQGPFSEEMNLAMIHQYNIQVLVTKESGKTGGEDTKIAAATAADIPVFMIRRPPEQVGANFNGSNVKEFTDTKTTGLTCSFKETLAYLSDITGISLSDTDRSIRAFGKPDSSGDIEQKENAENEMPGSSGQQESRIILAGIGMGTARTMTEEVREAIASADYRFGAPRMLQVARECVPVSVCRGEYTLYQAEKVIPVIKGIEALHPDRTPTFIILFSGDSGFYSGASGMLKALEEAGFVTEQISVMPGISSLSYLSAAAGIPWEDAAVVSLHGVPETIWRKQLLQALTTGGSGKVFFLTSGASDVRKLGELLMGLSVSCRLVLGFQLSYPDETIISVTPEECATIKEEGLYCGFILVRRRDTWNNPLNPKVDRQNLFQNSFGAEKTEMGDGLSQRNHQSGVHQEKEFLITPGIRDAEFIRGKVPMTKEEIRELVICKLHLQTGSVLYDIGSGTGSIAVEAGLLPEMGEVIAIEQNPEAVELIRQNAEKFGAAKVHIVQGKAPEILKQKRPDLNLPKPTHAFIGGTKGNLQEILKTLQAMNPEIRVVMTAVTLETIRDMQDVMEKLSIVDEDVVAVSISRAAQMGRYHLMHAANTVYIFSFSFHDKV